MSDTRPRHDAVPGATVEDCYEAHRVEVFRLGLRYGGGSSSFAEDVTHDVFLKVLEREKRLDQIDDMSAWLYRVTANVAISRLRREQSIFRRHRRAGLDGADAVETSPEETLALQQEAARAMAQLRDLPARERVVVCMKLLDGKSQKEIADLLSMSEGYVSKLLTRARQRIEAEQAEARHV